MTRTIQTYFAGCYLLCAWLLSGPLLSLEHGSDWTNLFTLLVGLSYPLTYLLPALALTALAAHFTRPLAIRRPLTIMIAWLSTVCTFSLLYADVRLFDLYGFHLNGFVLNLVTTPGGIESLGADATTYSALIYLSLGVMSLHGLWMLVCLRGWISMSASRTQLAVLATVYLCLAVSERALFALADVRNDGRVLAQAVATPFYSKVTARTLLTRYGLVPTRAARMELGSQSSAIEYPLHPITSTPTLRKPNLVWLVAESLRWDMLDPDIMPETSRYAGDSLNLIHHYSGGNGTRQGLFSLFYGLYGSYWDAFLLARKGPVLLDLLKEQGYRLAFYTSASFTYPEFDQTLFAGIPTQSLHQADTALTPWQRDLFNTDQIVEQISRSDSAQPFMIFMFYESTHARYDFPEDSAIREPYPLNVNYLAMNRDQLSEDIEGLKNRYINSSHFVDSQMARIYKALEATGQDDNTIVMVTGDHGEAFMEHGFWGHNSGFSEEQIRVPMVLHIPDTAPARITRMTSHTDIIPTLMPYFEVDNPVSDYSLGLSVTSGRKRKEIVISDWSGIALVSEQYKFTIPLKFDISSPNSLFTAQDISVPDSSAYLTSHADRIAAVIGNTRRFSGGQYRSSR